MEMPRLSTRVDVVDGVFQSCMLGMHSLRDDVWKELQDAHSVRIILMEFWAVFGPIVVLCSADVSFSTNGSGL